MQKRHKDLLRSLVVELRHILIGFEQKDGTLKRGDLDRELERLGVAPNGHIISLDALPNFNDAERQAYRVATTQLLMVPGDKRAAVRSEIVECAAYTWINRLFALRAMEARNLIENVLRDNDGYRALVGQRPDHISERLYVLYEESPERTIAADKGWWAVIEDACMEQAKALPGLFALDEPAAVLRPTAAALLQCIALVGGRQQNFTLEEVDAAFADPDAIGWAYQFYQEESKGRIYEKLGKGGKATTRAEISAATQLFTEPYMVQWLLQNSLGRSYHEGYPDSKLPETWPYYIQPERLNPATGLKLAELTVLDPCMGSGHFLRTAFDMLVDMYHEQFPDMDMTTIATTILDKHLYGIDIDPRAVQLTSLTLYLRSWELIREEQSRQRIIATSSYKLLTRNLATTPTFFNFNCSALEHHLQRHPQDKMLRSLLEGVLRELQRAEILGSLLRPGEQLDKAIDELRQDHTIEMDFEPEEAEFRRNVTALAKSDRDELKQLLLNRAITSFSADVNNRDDMSAFLFGREAIRGTRLIQVLVRHYAVVVTNPPYMGSRNMDGPLKKFVEQHYPAGKRDLYAAFILRCLELCQPNGRVAMVTMQSWMFLRNYADLRALPEEKLIAAQKKRSFAGILRETSIEALAHLGGNAFAEISGEVVKSVMYTIRKSSPLLDHQITAFRQVNLKSLREKAKSLKTGKAIKKLQFTVVQKTLLQVDSSIISIYHLPQVLLDLLRKGETVGRLGYVSWGVSSSNNDRFLRLWWEVPVHNNRWFPHVKGGGYCKWEGLDFWAVEWRDSGIAIKTFILERYPYLKNNYEIKVRDSTVNTPGWTFSSMVGKGLAVRQLHTYQITNAKSPAIFLREQQLYVGGFLNSIVSTFILRGLTPSLNVDEGYIASLPIKKDDDQVITKLVRLAVYIKKNIIRSDVAERQYCPSSNGISMQNSEAILHLIEGMINTVVIKIYNLSEQNIQQIQDEIGTPAGWYPLITNYDALPSLPAGFDLPPLPQELCDYLATHQRIDPSHSERERIKTKLRALYEAGPKQGIKVVEQSENSAVVSDENEEGEDLMSGAHTPIPTETFLEELSVKMQLHPISVYWFLEELRAEGVRCLPEERRLLEDRLSVLVLRLLGHRWPRQLEGEEAVPAWAEKTGIIPLVAVPERTTMAERLRGRLRAEDGDLGAQKTERLLIELTQMSVEQWLRRRFFAYHVSQFKARPVVWHLVSSPAKAVWGKDNEEAQLVPVGSQQNELGVNSDKPAQEKLQGGKSGKKKRGNNLPLPLPTFECLLYYHATSGDALARIRTQYVEPLIRAERSKISSGQRGADGRLDEKAILAHARIKELEAFTQQLRTIEEQGFDSPEMQQLFAIEPLDEWSGNGYIAPLDRDALYRRERAWHVDINDGVRVNIAPLQREGVLAQEVLRPADVRKALADRAHWRADERRWVREGKLPRCGWLAEDVPASQAWKARVQQEERSPELPQQQHLPIE